jgi:glycosyltransferase involved in cell wall biosynthesis
MESGRKADVIYASATYAASAAASLAARRPLVAKLVSDPAYERAYRYGLFRGTLEEFQQARGARLDALRRGRTMSLRRARTIVVPSEYLARIARGFGIEPGKVQVVTNPAPDVTPSREVAQRNTFVYAGRLTHQKALGVAIDAISLVPDARLVVIGDGPERATLERRARDVGLDGRVEFRGARPRAEVLDALRTAWAAVLSSAWENLPHAAVEALAVGTPVVATSVGGVPEVVHDRVNGLLVRPGSTEAFARAIQELVDDAELRNRLAGAAAGSVAGFSRTKVYGELERLLREAAA